MTGLRTRLVPIVAWALLAALAPGCAYRHTRPLARYEPGGGYRYQALSVADAANSEETFIVLALSGGGTRAAAFSYGAIRALHDQRLGGTRRLLGEVDVISSVSGGSFAAAFLGVFGPETFLRKFPEAVLYRSLHWELAGHLLLPWNLVRLASPWYARSDLVGEYYDRVIFDGKRFADLPLTRPLIVLNATDIVEGAQFSFTQEYFDRLCADLGRVPIGRAVVASSAFPVAFTPVTLPNYPKESCGYARPVGDALDDLARSPDGNPTAHSVAKSWLSYELPKRRFIHLSDGGLSDNLGLRAPYNALELDTWGLRELINAEPHPDEPRKIKRLVFIVVDAKPKSDSRHDGSGRPPSVYTVLNAAGTNPMENYSTETIAMLHAWFAQWNVQAEHHANTIRQCAELARDECTRRRCSRADRARARTSCLVHFGVWDPVAKEPTRVPHPELYMVHVRFDAMPDGPLKHDLQNVDTALQLPREQVEALIEWGGRLLREAPDYQRLVRDLAPPSTSR